MPEDQTWMDDDEARKARFNFIPDIAHTGVKISVKCPHCGEEITPPSSFAFDKTRMFDAPNPPYFPLGT